MITLHSPTAWQRHDNMLSLDTLMNTDTEWQYKHDDGGAVNNSMNDLMIQSSSHWTSMELSHIMIASLSCYHIRMLFSMVGFTANILWNSRWISSLTMDAIGSSTLRDPVFARRQSWTRAVMHPAYNGIKTHMIDSRLFCISRKSCPMHAESSYVCSHPHCQHWTYNRRYYSDYQHE